jgi:hypothetical protein
MSIIKLPLRYEGSLGKKTIYTLFDLGTTFSCINEAAVEGVESLAKSILK